MRPQGRRAGKRGRRRRQWACCAREQCGPSSGPAPQVAPSRALVLTPSWPLQCRKSQRRFGTAAARGPAGRHLSCRSLEALGRGQG